MSSLTSRSAPMSRRTSRASAICGAGTTAVATREIDSSTSMAGKWPAVASRRVSTMCPSRIERAVSAIGSLWSSPSTSTVYRPVIEPVAPGRRRLSGGEPHLPLRHRGPGDRVHEEQHVAALVAEGLGDAGGDERGLEPHQWRLVGGGDDDDGAGQALGPEVLLEELPYLAAALADQADHPDVGVGAAGDLRQQRRLAHSGTGEDAQALPPPTRDLGVEWADT